MPHTLAAHRLLSPGLLFAVLAISTHAWAQRTAPLGDTSFQFIHPPLRLAQAFTGPPVHFYLRDAGAVPSSGTTMQLARRESAFGPIPAKLPDRASQRGDDLDHIPLAGPLIQRISQKTKAHPQLTRVIKFLIPAN